MVIFIICQAAGIIILMGSIILLYKGRIKLTEAVGNSNLNQEQERNAFEAKINGIISVKAQTPALGLFALGFLLVVIPPFIDDRGGSIGEEYTLKEKEDIKIQLSNGEKRELTVLMATSHPYPIESLGGKIPKELKVVRGKNGFFNRQLLV